MKESCSRMISRQYYTELSTHLFEIEGIIERLRTLLHLFVRILQFVGANWFKRLENIEIRFQSDFFEGKIRRNVHQLFGPYEKFNQLFGPLRNIHEKLLALMNNSPNVELLTIV